MFMVDSTPGEMTQGPNQIPFTVVFRLQPLKQVELIFSMCTNSQVGTCLSLKDFMKMAKKSIPLNCIFHLTCKAFNWQETDSMAVQDFFWETGGAAKQASMAQWGRS